MVLEGHGKVQRNDRCWGRRVKTGRAASWVPSAATAAAVTTAHTGAMGSLRNPAGSPQTPPVPLRNPHTRSIRASSEGTGIKIRIYNATDKPNITAPELPAASNSRQGVGTRTVDCSAI